MVSVKVTLREFVLRTSVRASPLKKPLLTLAGWMTAVEVSALKGFSWFVT